MKRNILKIAFFAFFILYSFINFSKIAYAAETTSCIRNQGVLGLILADVFDVVSLGATTRYTHHFNMTAGEAEHFNINIPQSLRTLYPNGLPINPCSLPSKEAYFNLSNAYILDINPASLIKNLTSLSLPTPNNPLNSKDFEADGVTSSLNGIFLLTSGSWEQTILNIPNPAYDASRILQIQTYHSGDMVCIGASIPPVFGSFIKWATSLNILYPLACRYKPDPGPVQNFNTFITPDSNSASNQTPIVDNGLIRTGKCFNAHTSSSNGFIVSMFYPITKCVSEIAESIFFSNESTANGNAPLAEIIRRYFTPYATVMLVISFSIFGMKFALGAIQKKSEIFMFFVKVIFVLTFTLSTNLPNYFPASTTSTSNNLSGSQFVAGFASTLTDGLIGIVSNFDTTTIINTSYNCDNQGQSCYNNRKPTAIEWGKICPMLSTISSSHKMFALVDCHIPYYFGMIPSEIIDSGGKSGMGLIQIMFPAFLSSAILLAILIVLFLYFVISVFVSVVHVYCISKICQALVIILAPLFIPFCLFQVTKDYYQSWARLILSYCLQPMVYVVMLQFMFATFDLIIVGDCQQKITPISYPSLDISSCDNISNCTQKMETSTVNSLTLSGNSTLCKNSFLYRLQTLTSSNNLLVPTFLSSFFHFNSLSTEAFVKLILPLIALVLCSLIFWTFLEQLSKLAADLTGGFPIGDMAVSPTALFKNTFKLIKAIAKKDPKEAAAIVNQSDEKENNGDPIVTQKRDNPADKDGNSASGAAAIPGQSSSGTSATSGKRSSGTSAMSGRASNTSDSDNSEN